MRDYVRAEMDELTLEPVWWVGTFLPAELVHEWPWSCFQLLQDSLERAARDLGFMPAHWELKLAEYSLIMDGWKVRFRVWPVEMSGR